MNDPRRIALGLLFLGILATGLYWVLTGDDPRGIAAPATTTASTLPPQPPTTSSAPRPGADPVSTVASTTTSTAPEGLAAPDAVELQDVLPAVQRALAAWGEFAVTGDLSLVADVFDVRGPQYGQLVEESAALLADPLGPPPYVFAMGEVELRRPRPQRVVLVGPVSISRPGETEQTFRWRLHLRWSGSEWLLWTVEEVDAG